MRRTHVTGKKIQLVLMAILLNLVCFIGVFTVNAYLEGQDEAVNSFSVGNNETAIIEDYEEVQHLRPGMNIDKAVSVKNTGRNACFVRVMALFSDSRAEEYAETDINSSCWSLGDDGYYYYRNVLQAGGTTENLFSHVRIADNVEQEKLKGFEIIIYAESINAETGGFQ